MPQSPFVEAGKQTLGQEYCDIGLAKRGGASVPLPPGSSLRLYTLLRVLVPYFQVRLGRKIPMFVNTYIGVRTTTPFDFCTDFCI